MTSIDDVRIALEVLKDYCSNQSSCTSCKMRYTRSGNSYYCGVTRNKDYAPLDFEIEYPKSKKAINLNEWND